MPSASSTPPAPLSTSRPWISVAGCLGGGALAGLAVGVLVAAAAAVLLFTDLAPIVGRGSGRESQAWLEALGQLRESPALRVATRDVDVRVDASVPTEATLRAWLVPVGPGWTVELGRTKVEVLAPGNRVQYVIPMRDAAGAPAEVSWRRLKVLTEVAELDGSGEATEVVELVEVTLPPPQVDAELVEVQSDPAKLRIQIDRDWVDHVVRDETARNEALASIRAAVLASAASPAAMPEVRDESRKIVASMIRALLPEELRATRIRVRWADEDELPGAPREVVP